jgi:hypothetical protein
LQIITFKNLNVDSRFVKNNNETFDMCQRITLAHHYAENKLYCADLTGGVHALSFHVILELCKHIEVQTSDSFWDIGVGLPLLAFSLSAAAVNGIVLGTDLGNYNYNTKRIFFICNLLP